MSTEKISFVAAVEEALLVEWRRLHRNADESDDFGEHVGFARDYRNKADGIWDALQILRGLRSDS